jgi:citronellol/citronellal dehydrogenase
VNRSGRLAGKTAIVTGATEGIGYAISHAFVREGARVVLVARRVEPGEQLVRELGSDVTAFVAGDVGDPATADRAVATAQERFGGLDVLVNNASAISLTGTLDTPMKRFDLMHQVNVRGTFLCSQKAVPHLKKAANPHILNLAPPLHSTLQARWFAPHVGYTMAKYGMTLCVLGMAEEFRADGIAVNALWPRTAIDTEAIRLIAGHEARQFTRSVEIMGDAAYAILTRPSRSFTGQFLIDDEVLGDAGLTDLSRYRREGVTEDQLRRDFFV